MTWEVRQGDVLDRLREMPDRSVHCCITSPPYWGLRDYGVEGQIGLEATPEAYVETMVAVFGEVRRVLRDDGTCWVNIGDTYNGYMANQRATSISENNQHARPVFESGHGPRCRDLKPKDLVGIPWRLALALQDDGWYLRADIIWAKPNPMPESVTDRPTKAHEYVFLLSKSARYFYDVDAIKEPCSENTHARISQDLAAQVGSFRANGGNKTNGPMKAVIAGSTRKMTEEGSGNKNNRSFEAACVLEVKDRNARTVWPLSRAEWMQIWDEAQDAGDVWKIPTQSYAEAHFATYPEALVEPCVKAGCPAGGTVLDPFAGSGTTIAVAVRLGRHAIGIELNADYIALARDRIGRAERPHTHRSERITEAALFGHPGGGAGGGEPPAS